MDYKTGQVDISPEVSFNKDCLGLLKIILEQNYTILLVNKMLLEYLAVPAVIVRADK